MCFFKTEKSKVLVAKRNIKVYKIGVYADNDSFNPFFYQAFEYRVNQIVFTKVKFTDTINRGFHSYLMCELVPFINDLNVYSGTTFMLQISLLEDPICLGEFIIPEGATYCLNKYREAVSDKLMYTGNYVRIDSDKIYNSKDLWKEK
nr:MAG TPA: hypothetical protein [Crassvirales sp.]